MNYVTKLLRIVGELIFEIKYHFGIAKEGVDFVTLGQEPIDKKEKP